MAIDFTTKLTDAGINAITDSLATTTPFNIDTWRLGADAAIPLDGTNTNVSGTIVDSGTAAELEYDIVSDDQIIIRIILDESMGPYDFGNVGLFSSGTMIAMGTFSQLVPKTPNAVGVTGDRIVLSLIITFINLGDALSVNNITPTFASLPFVQEIADLPDANIAPFEAYIVREDPSQNRPITAIRNEEPSGSGSFVWTFDYHNILAGDATGDANRFEIDITTGTQSSYINGNLKSQLRDNGGDTVLDLRADTNESLTIIRTPIGGYIQSLNNSPLYLNDDGNAILTNRNGSNFNIGRSTSGVAKLSVNDEIASPTQLANFANTFNNSSFTVASVNAANNWLNGTTAGDTALLFTNNLHIGTSSSNSIEFIVNNDQDRLVINSDGNIQIGTSSSISSVGLNTYHNTSIFGANNGGPRAGFFTNSTSSYLVLDDNTSADGSGFFSGTDYAFMHRDSTTSTLNISSTGALGKINFSTGNNVNRALIDETGRFVLLGDNITGVPLTISGSSNTDAIVAQLTDTGQILGSQNSSAAFASQFTITHDSANVVINNNRGALEFQYLGNFGASLDTNGEFQVGDGTNSSSSLRVQQASAVGTPNTNANAIVIDGSGDHGLSIMSTGLGIINFGDASSPNDGQINYNHSSEALSLIAGGLTRLQLDNSQVIIHNGSTSFATPTLSRSTDLDTGIVWLGGDDISIVAGGVQVGRGSNNGGNAYQWLVNASAGEANPSLAFDSDPNTGLYNPTGDSLGLVVNGTERIRITGSFGNTDGQLQLLNGTGFAFADGTVTNPGISFASDTDTGLYRPTTNAFSLVAGGSEKARVDSDGLKVGDGSTTSIEEVDNIQKMYAGNIVNVTSSYPIGLPPANGSITSLCSVPAGWTVDKISSAEFRVTHGLSIYQPIKNLSVQVTHHENGLTGFTNTIQYYHEYNDIAGDAIGTSYSDSFVVYTGDNSNDSLEAASRAISFLVFVHSPGNFVPN